MAPASNEEQFKFLISCIRYSNNGKVRVSIVFSISNFKLKLIRLTSAKLQRSARLLARAQRNFPSFLSSLDFVPSRYENDKLQIEPNAMSA